MEGRWDTLVLQSGGPKFGVESVTFGTLDPVQSLGETQTKGLTCHSDYYHV